MRRTERQFYVGILRTLVGFQTLWILTQKQNSIQGKIVVNDFSSLVAGDIRMFEHFVVHVQ